MKTKEREKQQFQLGLVFFLTLYFCMICVINYFATQIIPINRYSVFISILLTLISMFLSLAIMKDIAHYFFNIYEKDEKDEK